MAITISNKDNNEDTNNNNKTYAAKHTEFESIISHTNSSGLTYLPGQSYKLNIKHTSDHYQKRDEEGNVIYDTSLVLTNPDTGSKTTIKQNSQWVEIFANQPLLLLKLQTSNYTNTDNNIYAFCLYNDSYVLINIQDLQPIFNNS